MLIVLEGVDGSGKTTLLNTLAKRMSNSVVIKEKTDFVEQMEQNPEKAAEIFEQFCKERVELGKKIQSYLDQSKVVIMDRYYPSSICYQIELCREKGYDCKGILSAYQKYYFQWLKPDLIMVLDTDLETCIKRIKERGERVDKEMLKKVKKCYDSLGDILDNVYYIKNEQDTFSIIKLFKKK
jgi:dTMP kinase